MRLTVQIELPLELVHSYHVALALNLWLQRRTALEATPHSEHVDKHKREFAAA